MNPLTPSSGSDDGLAASLHPVQRQALWLLLGGGLDEAGKERWVDSRLADGWTVADLFDEALDQMDGMVAT